MASNFFDESKKNMVANNKVAIFAHIIPRNIFIFKNWFVFFDPVRNFPSSVRYFFFLFALVIWNKNAKPSHNIHSLFAHQNSMRKK